MIQFSNRYDAYAYRNSQFPLSEALKGSNFEAGIFVTLNANGELVLPTDAGTAGGGSATGVKVAGEKVFMLTTSKVAGRDLVSGKATTKGNVLMGAFIAATNQYDATGTYAPGTALTVKPDGKLKPITPTASVVEGDIVGYCVSGVQEDSTIRVYILP